MKIHLMGGDRRQLYLAAYISEKGFPVTVSYLGSDAPPQWDADLLILPLPVSKDGHHLFAPLAKETLSLSELYTRFCGKRIYGGKLPSDSPEGAIDYYESEELTLLNAALTAEGAIGLAITHTAFSLLNQPVLILGAGRIGQALALRLQALGANVTVAARRPESLALCRSFGSDARFYEDLPLNRFRLVFNTVPSRILNREKLFKLPEGALLMELASAPGGFDEEEAKRANLQVLQAPSLPGRLMPETAARLIGDYILKEIEAYGT